MLQPISVGPALQRIPGKPQFPPGCFQERHTQLPFTARQAAAPATRGELLAAVIQLPRVVMRCLGHLARASKLDDLLSEPHCMHLLGDLFKITTFPRGKLSSLLLDPFRGTKEANDRLLALRSLPGRSLSSVAPGTSRSARYWPTSVLADPRTTPASSNTAEPTEAPLITTMIHPAQAFSQSSGRLTVGGSGNREAARASVRTW